MRNSVAYALHYLNKTIKEYKDKEKIIDQECYQT